MAERKGAAPTPGTPVRVKQVPIEHEYPAEVQPLFAPHVLIQNQQDYFELSFFTQLQPLLLNEGDIDNVESMTATCVARLVLTPAKFRALIDAAEVNWKNHQKAYGNPQQPVTKQLSRGNDRTGSSRR
jgi:hypothetical protein